MDYKIRWTQRGFDTPLINKFICTKISEQFGGKLQLIGVSSAPLHESTQAMIQAALNVKVVNGEFVEYILKYCKTNHQC